MVPKPKTAVLNYQSSWGLLHHFSSKSGKFCFSLSWKYLLLQDVNFVNGYTNVQHVVRCQKAQKLPNFSAKMYIWVHICHFHGIYSSYFQESKHTLNMTSTDFSGLSSSMPYIWGISTNRCQQLQCHFWILGQYCLLTFWCHIQQNLFDYHQLEQRHLVLYNTGWWY